MTDGGCVSFTVTVCVAGAEALPCASVAVQVMVVTPTGYGAFSARPSLRTAFTVAFGQLSPAVAVPGFTEAEHWPGSLLTLMFGGALTVGISVSLTVTLKLQAGPAVELQVTAVVPIAKNEPDAGEQLIVPQLEPSPVGAE